MADEPWISDEPDDFDDDDYCHRCDNEGFILICPDDLCRGAGECMHGDGEIVCPNCAARGIW